MLVRHESVLRLDSAIEADHVVELDSRASTGIRVRLRDATKRAIDVTLSAVMLVLCSPLFLLVAAAIKLEDRGPAFYMQARWGSGGKEFLLYKFRTMVPDSDERFGIILATEDDPRVTRIGRLLRRTGLDELPQLINILKGQMSFVGPRALAVGEKIVLDDGQVITYEEADGFWARLAVRPGLTGMATIYMPKDVPPIDKFEKDLEYIATQSLWLDIKLIAMSFVISLRGNWETRERKL